jgi:hypothetical protein
VLKDQQSVMPLRSNGKKNNGEAVRQSKPFKVRLHKNGTISARVGGRWYHNEELPRALYLSALAATHRRIVKQKFKTGRPLVAGSPVLLGRRHN